MKTTIIGAGISGLWLGYQLKNAGHDISIIEKSRGVGGRIATKRIGTEKFDHGAQFYTDDIEMKDLHKIWSDANLSRPWFTKKNKMRFTVAGGMTLLAKELQKSLNIQLNQRLVKIVKNENQLVLELDSGERLTTDQLILTCPLPQTLELLNVSGIDYPTDLKTIQYEKAIVFLVEKVNTTSEIMKDTAYLEPAEAQDIFSIADQQKKQNCAEHSWTITMTSAFSEIHFEKSDEAIIEAGVTSIKKQLADFGFKNIVLKKWRYSHPKTKYHSPFVKLADSPIYLAGDAFGGPSMTGAIRSANVLWSTFANKN
jgi:renalase